MASYITSGFTVGMRKEALKSSEQSSDSLGLKFENSASRRVDWKKARTVCTA